MIPFLCVFAIVFNIISALNAQKDHSDITEEQFQSLVCSSRVNVQDSLKNII